MSTFQLLMLGASAYFAFKIYEHMQTLQDPENSQELEEDDSRSADAFSTFSPESLKLRADEAFESGDLQRALALLMEADAKDPNNSDTLFKMAYIMQQNNDNVSALDYYKSALEIDKNNEFIHNSMASIYRENKEYASAKMHLNASINLDPNNAITYYNFGNLLVDMEHLDEAKTMYKKAIEINVDFLEARDELEKLEEQ